MSEYYRLNSLKQIKTLFNSKFRNDLIELVGRRLRVSKDFIYECYKDADNDLDFYIGLMKGFKKYGGKDQAFEYRAKKRLNDVKNIIGEHEVFMYLDYGSDDCLIPNTISKDYGLNKSSAFASDISDKCEYDSNVTFLKLVPFEHSHIYNKKYAESFDLFSAFQSLHHVKDLDFRMEEFRDLAKKGCYFIIREHDASSVFIRMLIDVEHLLYEVFLEDRDLDDFIMNYYALYFSKKELVDLMEKYGFRLVFSERMELKKNPTKYYYSLFERI